MRNFRNLKTLLLNDSFFANLNFDKYFVLNINSSNFALVAVLPQKTHGTNYSIVKKDLLVVVWFGRNFITKTDH